MQHLLFPLRPRGEDTSLLYKQDTKCESTLIHPLDSILLLVQGIVVMRAISVMQKNISELTNDVGFYPQVMSLATSINRTGSMGAIQSREGKLNVSLMKENPIHRWFVLCQQRLRRHTFLMDLTNHVRVRKDDVHRKKGEENKLQRLDLKPIPTKTLRSNSIHTIPYYPIRSESD